MMQNLIYYQISLKRLKKSKTLKVSFDFDIFELINNAMDFMPLKKNIDDKEFGFNFQVQEKMYRITVPTYVDRDNWVKEIRTAVQALKKQNELEN